MNLEKIVKSYLSESRIMQLATAIVPKEKEQRARSDLSGPAIRASDEKKRSFVSLPQPWVCTVHFYTDENFNFYWLSTPARRHSEEIAQNQKVAAAILVHEDTRSEKYVIGISVEGTAGLATAGEWQEIENDYTKKLNKPAQLMKDIREQKNPHKFYKLRPTKIVLFDSKNFTNNPRQELELSNG